MRFLLLALALLFVAGCESRTSQKPTIKAYQADWCIPCQQDKPALAKLARQGYKVEQVNCTTNKPAWVRSFPTYVVCKDGRCYPPVHSLDEAIRQLGQ